MIGLYFGGQWFQATFGNAFGNIELDAVQQEGHEWTADATTSPVEEGSPISDHVIEQADRLSIKGFISDTPIRLSQSIEGTVNDGSVIGNRTQSAFDLLYKLVKAKEVITVYTKHAIYDDMVLTSVALPRSPGQGEALEFDLEFIHIRKVASQTVEVPKGIGTKKGTSATGRKAEMKKDAGKQQPETVKKPSSALSRMFN